MECAINGDKHSCDRCTILNDVSYLHEHFIAYCLQLKHIQKQMSTIMAINRIQAAALQTNSDDDDDIVLDNSNIAIDDNDEQDS